MERIEELQPAESNAGLLRLVADHPRSVLSGKMCALLRMAADEIESLRNLNDELRKVCDLLRVDGEFAHRLAVMLECALLDKTGCWNEAHRTLDEYRAAVHTIDPPMPTFMGEPIGMSDLPPNAELNGGRRPSV